MIMNFEKELLYRQNKINDYIENIIPSESKYIQNIISSMRYSLLAGGKRLRPILLIGTGEIFNCNEEDLYPFAAAIEMIHTYSLIHDDLPSMDNDDFRRGKPTNHKVYGDAIALLAGDGLLNLSYEHMLSFLSLKNEARFVKAAQEIAKAAGINGMIGGQVVDIENEGKDIDENLMEYMHNNKTGALITASVRCGAIIGEGSCEDVEKLTRYAKYLGLAFQIVDDILDVIGDSEKLGKKSGRDLKNKKTTYVTMYGLEKAKEKAENLTKNAIDEIESFGEKAIFLKELTLYLLDREY